MNCSKDMQIVAKLKTLKKNSKLVFLITTVGVTLVILKTIKSINYFNNKIVLLHQLHNLLLQI